jgi:hypothetical protein
MSGNTKKKARESAERCVPLGIFERAKIVEAFVAGYMAGHAAHTRWASKAIGDYRAARASQGKPASPEVQK